MKKKEQNKNKTLKSTNELYYEQYKNTFLPNTFKNNYHNCLDQEV